MIATIGATALGIGPLVAPLFGSKGQQVSGAIATGVNDLTAIGSLITTVEVAFQNQPTSGPLKLAAAINLIGPLLKTSEMVSGKKIADDALFTKGTAELAQAVVDILNSLDQDAVKTEITHT